MNVDELIDCLLSAEDAEERRRAAEELACEELNVEILDAFARGLLDSDSGVKDFCSRIIAQIPSDYALMAAEVTSPLIKHKDIEARNLASDILFRIGSPATTALTKYLRDEDPQVRQFALDIVGNVGSHEADEVIFELLFDDDSNVRSSAVDAIGKLSVKGALEHLVALYNQDEDLQPVIIEALGKIGSPAAQDFLIDRLRNEEDIFLQTAAIDSLAFLGEDITLCDSLLELLPQSAPELQLIMLKTIFAIAMRNEHYVSLPPELRDVARKALLDYDPDIRAAGLIALGEKYDIEDVDALVNELSYNNPETQQHILINLLTNSAPEVVERFFIRGCSVASPDGSDVLYLSYLPLIWDESNPGNAALVIDLLLRMIFSTYRGYSTEIVEILLRLDYDRVVSRLREYLTSSIPEEAEDALDVAANLHINDLLPEIQELCMAEDPIGSQAQRVLRQLKDV